MKNIFWFSILLITIVPAIHAQTNINVGGGYFGHTITHPGIVLEYEIEKEYSEKASLPIRIDLGFYAHPRNNNGLFLDISCGFRRYFKSGLFLEESIGIGVLESIINSEGVFKVDEDGNISDASRINPPDVIPSLTLGIGYNLSKKKEKQNLIWLRPKIYWQYPHKTTSTFNPVVQVGFTHQLK